MDTLLGYIDRNGPRTDEEWGKLFGVSRSHFHGLRTGTAQPSKKVMERIAVETGGEVPVTAWFAAVVRGAA